MPEDDRKTRIRLLKKANRIETALLCVSARGCFRLLLVRKVFVSFLAVVLASSLYFVLFVEQPGNSADMSMLERGILSFLVVFVLMALYLVMGTYSNPHLIPGGSRLVRIRDYYRKKRFRRKP